MVLHILPHFISSNQLEEKLSSKKLSSLPKVEKIHRSSIGIIIKWLQSLFAFLVVKVNLGLLTSPDCATLYKQDSSSFIDMQVFSKGLLFAKQHLVHNRYAELGG